MFEVLQQISASLTQPHLKFENLYNIKKKPNLKQCHWKKKSREQFLKFSTEPLISGKVHLDQTRLRLYFTSSNQNHLTGFVFHKSVWQRAYRSSTSSCAKYTGPPSVPAQTPACLPKIKEQIWFKNYKWASTTDAAVSQLLKIKPRNNSSGIPGVINTRGHGAIRFPESLISIHTPRTLPKMKLLRTQAKVCADFQPHPCDYRQLQQLPAGGTVT